MSSLFKEFKEFIARGGIFEAAVGLIMALAFVPVVGSLVDDVLMQIVSAIFGQPDFGAISFGLGSAEIYIGRFINAIISFAMIGFVVFLMVKAYNASTKPAAAEEAGPSEVELLTEIRDSLRRS